MAMSALRYDIKTWNIKIAKKKHFNNRDGQFHEHTKIKIQNVRRNINIGKHQYIVLIKKWLIFYDHIKRKNKWREAIQMEAIW